MSERSKKILKFLGLGVLWVYLLSIRLGGETMFYYANDILVKNQIVEAIHHQFLDAVDAAGNLASSGFSKISGKKRRL
jgi:hypothetical protein